MTDENKTNKNNFQVLEFPKPTDEQTPAFVIEILEKVLAKAKEGKLKTLITHFGFVQDDTEEYQGGTVLWNDSGNAVEMVGVTEILKHMAMDYVFSDHDHDHEE